MKFSKLSIITAIFILQIKNNQLNAAKDTSKRVQLKTNTEYQIARISLNIIFKETIQFLLQSLEQFADNIPIDPELLQLINHELNLNQYTFLELLLDTNNQSFSKLEQKIKFIFQYIENQSIPEDKLKQIKDIAIKLSLIHQAYQSYRKIKMYQSDTEFHIEASKETVISIELANESIILNDLDHDLSAQIVKTEENTVATALSNFKEKFYKTMYLIQHKYISEQKKIKP